jgi:hypothetical protein
MRSFIVTPFAVSELQEIEKWYTEISIRLGNAFWDDWEKLADAIHNRPLQFQIKNPSGMHF